VTAGALRWAGPLAVGAVLAVLVLWAGLGDTPSKRPLTLPGVGIATFLEPVSHGFADRVQASVEVVLLPRRVDVGSVQVAARFNPYRIMSRRRAEVSERGVTSIRWTYRLRCVQANCRPEPGRARNFQFPPAQVSFRRLDGTPGVRRQQWHILRSISRLDAREAAREDFQAREHPLPAISYRVEPGQLATWLVVASALLALLGGALLWSVVGPLVVGLVGARRFARLDPVQRQLLVLRDAVERSDATAQRRALDALSLSLGHSGNGEEELSLGARRLAWSPRRGSSSDVLGFADEVAGHATPKRKARR
jgi:hypothetical protein